MKNKYVVKGKLTNLEIIKKKSNYLRGTIKEDLKNKTTGGFEENNNFLIRFHGMYQQDDRDLRNDRIKQKLEPKYSMMLRCRIPGGLINTKQWIKIDNFAEKNTIYKSIRITNRQTFQFHGILKNNLKKAHKMLYKINLDSKATANDVNRNVLFTTNINNENLYNKIYKITKKISKKLLPKSKAYSEIWLDKKNKNIKENEPILGKTYLPRKFKIAITVPPYNDVDIHANDMSFISIIKKKKLIGFNLLLGGGISIEHNNKLTWPRIASEIGFIKKKNIFKIVESVIKIQRDWGNRTNRKNAKTRYTLERVGIEIFKKEIEIRSNINFKKIKKYKFKSRSDIYGWKKIKKNKWNLTIFIENGRIINKKKNNLKLAILKIAKNHKGNFKLTANQNLIISNIKDKNKNTIQSIVEKYKLIKKISKQRKNSMACVSFPTCPLAMAESERFINNFINNIEKIMLKYKVEKEYIVLRISGCPNGCARAMLAEISLIGKSLNYYNLYIGGNKIGTRIPRLYLENIKKKEILFNIDRIIKLWSENKNKNEDFGDFCIRYKIIKPIINAKKDFWNNW